MPQALLTREDVASFRELQSVYVQDQHINNTMIHELATRLRNCEELHARHAATTRSGSASTCSSVHEHTVATSATTQAAQARRPESDGGVAAEDGGRTPNASVFCASSHGDRIHGRPESDDEDHDIPQRVHDILSPPTMSPLSAEHGATTSRPRSRLGCAVQDLAPCSDADQPCPESGCETTPRCADSASDSGGEERSELDFAAYTYTMPGLSLPGMEESIGLESHSVPARDVSSCPDGPAIPGFIPCTANAFGVTCPRLGFGRLKLWSCRYHAKWMDMGICATG